MTIFFNYGINEAKIHLHFIFESHERGNCNQEIKVSPLFEDSLPPEGIMGIDCVNTEYVRKG